MSPGSDVTITAPRSADGTATVPSTGFEVAACPKSAPTLLVSA